MSGWFREGKPTMFRKVAFGIVIALSMSIPAQAETPPNTPTTALTQSVNTVNGGGGTLGNNS